MTSTGPPAHTALNRAPLANPRHSFPVPVPPTAFVALAGCGPFARDAFAVADAANARKFVSVGFSMSGRFVQYLPLLSPDRIEAMVIIAGAPASAMDLSEELITDWAGRAGDRHRLRQIPAMFAVHPDPALLDEYADDAAKASRYALETTLRMLSTSLRIGSKADTL